MRKRIKRIMNKELKIKNKQKAYDFLCNSFSILNTRFIQHSTLTSLKLSAGFTLIEMMVVLAIMIMISTLTLTNYRQFGGKILLSNKAYDVALSIREAQVYGISARFQNDTTFQSIPVGMSFNLNNSNTEYFLFRDSSAEDGIFNTGGLEQLSKLTLPTGFVFKELCYTDGGTKDCGINRIDVTFKRPESDALIRVGGHSANTYDSFRIVLESHQGDTMTILVEASGQISVQR